MRAKRGYAKQVQEIQKQIVDLQRSIHGWAFRREPSEETKKVLAEIAQLKQELSQMTI